MTYKKANVQLKISLGCITVEKNNYTFDVIFK